MSHAEHFHNLKKLAAEDLSAAHILQHTITADLSAKLGNIVTSGPGTHGLFKPNDTATLSLGTVTGKKHWLSNLNNCSWAVFVVEQGSERSYVYVDLRNAQIELVPTLGMEGTFTGNLEFDHAPAIVICNVQDPRYFPIKRQHSLGYITILYGLAEQLFDDIDQYTEQANINCNYEKQKIKLNLSVMKLLWGTAVKEIDDADIAHQYYHPTLYGFAKECLVQVLHLITEVTGSGLYELSQPHHQRYRDALIYASHMKNLYQVSQEQHV